MLASGDFRQLSVVVKGGGRPEVLQACVKASPLWLQFQRLRLTGASMRIRGNAEFAAWLESVGDGTAAHVDRSGDAYDDQVERQREGGAHTILLPPSLTARVTIFTDASAFEARVHDVSTLADAVEAVKSGIVCPHNDSVDAHNTAVLAALSPTVPPTRLVAYESLPEQSGVEWAFASDEFMAHAHGPGIPDHAIDVKPHGVITCIRNLAPHLGVVNGSRLEVLRPNRHVIIARQLYAPFAVVAIPRLLFSVPIPKSDIAISRRQFPIRMAYACTCHRVQGATLPGTVGLDLRRPCFAHGQLYVGCSRNTVLENLVFLVNPEDIITRPEGRALLLTSVVYPELLSESIPVASALPTAAQRPPACIPDVPDADDAAERDLLAGWLGVSSRIAPRAARGGQPAGAARPASSVPCPDDGWEMGEPTADDMNEEYIQHPIPDDPST